MKDVNYLSFPGLNIDEFRMDKAAFSIFGHEIMWYGIIVTLGIVAASLYVLYRAKKYEGVKTDDVLDYAIWLVVCGIVGARLYYVFTSFSQYKGDTFLATMKNIIAVWNGGLAIYGGIIAGGLALAIVSRIKKIKLGKAFDMVAPGVMLGQLIGRWGNFCNAEAYGRETTLPWRMGIRPEGAEETIFVHPTFLYESLWNLVGFILINLFYKKKKFDGQIFFMYVSWYGFGRMLIEGLRTDSLYVGDFRISQVIGFACFFFGAAVLVAMEIVIRLRRREGSYEPVVLIAAVETAPLSKKAAKKAAEEIPAESEAIPSTAESTPSAAESVETPPADDCEEPLPDDESEETPEEAETPAPETTDGAAATTPDFDIASLYGHDEEDDEE